MTFFTRKNSSVTGQHQQIEQELGTARAKLLNYCGLDTFTMIKIWRKLKAI